MRRSTRNTGTIYPPVAVVVAASHRKAAPAPLDGLMHPAIALALANATGRPSMLGSINQALPRTELPGVPRRSSMHARYDPGLDASVSEAL